MDAARAHAFITGVLKLPSGSGGFTRAQAVLQKLAAQARLEDLPPVAEQLFYHAVQVEDITRGAAGKGIFGMAQEYYDTVFAGTHTAPDLNRVKLVPAGSDLARRVRLYLPEQTINAVLCDSARRYDGSEWFTSWEASDPRSDVKIYPELGNSARDGGRYLRYPDTDRASPVVGRIHGACWNLRQTRPDPPLKMMGNVYLPHKRKRIYDVGLATFGGTSFRLGANGFGGMKTLISVRIFVQE